MRFDALFPGPLVLLLATSFTTQSRRFGHGIGTAYALQMNEVAGAFSALGMGLNGVLTTLLVPLLVSIARIVGS